MDSSVWPWGLTLVTLRAEPVPRGYHSILSALRAWSRPPLRLCLWGRVCRCCDIQPSRRDRDLPGFSRRHGFEVLVISSRWECTIVYHGDRGRVDSFPLSHGLVVVRVALGTSIYPGMDGGSMTAICFDRVHVGRRRIPPCNIASITDVLSAATWDTHALVRYIAPRFDMGFAVYHRTN
jgi:hypothetical protein